MELNKALGDFVAMYHDTLREWIYLFTIFGEPSEFEPWGWQLMGHHLVINCFVLGEHVVVSPVFMGAEMIELDEGRFAGLRVFRLRADPRPRAGPLAVGRTAGDRDPVQVDAQCGSAARVLPGRVEGRHRAGAGRDNLVLPYAGHRRRRRSSRGQREALLALIETYVGRNAAAHAAVELERAERHLDETYFAWIGDPDSDGPFYYRVHSPVC